VYRHEFEVLLFLFKAVKLNKRQTMVGKVISVNSSYFFIQPNDPFQDNIFGHKSSLIDGRKRVLFGEIVEYDIGDRNGRPVAINIRVIVAVTPGVPATTPAGVR
jgi:cold shock CspA family protein